MPSPLAVRHRRARSRAGRHRRRALVVLAGIGLVAVLVAGCTTPLTGHGTVVTKATSASPAPTSGPTINLSDCSKLLNIDAADIPASRRKHLTFTCGKVPVPLNYDEPNSATIEIEVLRVHDDEAPKKVNSLLVNRGGPGAADLAFVVDLAAVISDDILTHYDLVGFDPRGVGLSNQIQCQGAAELEKNEALDPDLSTPTGFAVAQQAADQVATECATKYGSSLSAYNTVFTAMDMDHIRAAMGDTQLSYLGFSYGTELGAAYAHLYPQKLRVAVLDGAVDPTTDYITTAANQTKGFEDAFDQFAADCKTRPACKTLGDPRVFVQNLTNEANISPLKSSKADETRTATGGIVLTAVVEALYDENQWPLLLAALVQAQQGDAKGLFGLADEYNDDFSRDANTAISCNDTPAGITDATIQATATQWATAYPMFGAWNASSLFACENWQPVRHALPLPTATGSPPILVLGTTHDPATPYAGAQHLAATLTTGVLLTFTGQGHGAYLHDDDCVDGAVDNYLVDRIVPTVGTVCPG
jgi:pimeloyl-ACP methyl ester carboxylesterase